MKELGNLKLGDKVVQPSDIEELKTAIEELKTIVSAANANLASALDGTKVT